MRQIKHDTPFFVFDEWEKYKEITHFVTTRHGGVSEEPYLSLNIGFGTEDSHELVLKNRQLMAQSVGIPLESFVMLNQVHGVSVAVATYEMKGLGALDRESAIHATDAIISNQPGICLFIMAADCVPLLFYDPIKKAIGAAHAGWRGTVNQMAAATVQKMHDVFDCNYENIRVVIGPSIGPCCYHVGGEVIDHILRSFGTTDELISFENNDSSAYFNLWRANQLQLMNMGILTENIAIAELCTCCNHIDFYSSRFSKGITGRFGAGIMLKD